MDDPIEISVSDVHKMLENNPQLKLIDVREDFELEICKLPQSQQLTEEFAEALLKEAEPDRLLIFYCHHGGRSRAAAEYFQQQGFRNVRNMTGGIDAWALDIDPSIARY